LKALGAGSQAVAELKKKKKIVLYGSKGDILGDFLNSIIDQDDLFGVCYVRLANLTSTHDILDGAGDQTRVILGDKVTSLSIYFADSITQGKKILRCSNSINIEQATSFLTGVCLSNYKFVQKSYIGVDESAQFKRIASIAVVHSNFNLQDERVQFSLQCTRYSLFCRQVLSVRALEANPEVIMGFFIIITRFPLDYVGPLQKHCSI